MRFTASLRVPSDESLSGSVLRARRRWGLSERWHNHRNVTAGHGDDALIRWARLYDLGLRLWWRRGHRWRSGLLELLDLQPGQRVLDVGSGTGQLTFALADRVTPGGSVDGVDAATEMISRAQRKNRRRRRPVTFTEARAQELPFPDETFHAVTCTLALHHVAGDARSTAVEEMHRVVRPGGRLLVADFEPTADGRVPFGPLFRRGHAMHDGALDEAEQLLAAVGFRDLIRGPTSVRGIGQVVGTRPA